MKNNEPETSLSVGWNLYKITLKIEIHLGEGRGGGGGGGVVAYF